MIQIRNITYTVLLTLCFAIPAHASDYKSTIRSWKSYNDVANWLKEEWSFSKKEAKRVANIIKREGPQVVAAKSAKDTFENPQGWCRDAANFGIEALNEIDAEYKAQYVFIRNKKGPPHHWVTGFREGGNLYVIDFGAGSHWKGMMGVHGPYASLDGYREFLSKINYRTFELQSINWWPNPKETMHSGVDQKARTRATMVLGKFDRNNDDLISREEAPKKMKKNFRSLDVNGDDFLDEEELVSLPPKT